MKNVTKKFIFIMSGLLIGLVSCGTQPSSNSETEKPSEIPSEIASEVEESVVISEAISEIEEPSVISEIPSVPSVEAPSTSPTSEIQEDVFSEWSISVDPTLTTPGQISRTNITKGTTETQQIPTLADESFYHKNVIQIASCDKEGITQYTCQYGMVIITDQRLEHEYTYKIVKSPTENATGTATKSCSKCSSSEVILLPKLTDTTFYTVNRDESVPATCTKNGTIVYECEYGKITAVEKAKGHKYSAWVVVTNPSDTEKGKIKRVCQNGDDTEYFELPVLTDKSFWIENEAKRTEPTCTKTGSAQYKSISSTYNITVNVEIPAKGHDFGKWQIVTKPTLLTGGTAKHICKVCGTEHSIEIPNLTDSIWEKKTTVNPTCVEQGIDVYTSVYGSVEVTTNALGHEYSEWFMITRPSEEETGSMKKYCNHDGCTSEISETVPVLTDASFWYLKENIPSTCLDYGRKTYVSDLGEIVVEYGMLPHVFQKDYTFTKMPTLTETGIALRYCTLGCGTHTEEVVVPALSDKSWVKTEDEFDITYKHKTFGVITTSDQYGPWIVTIEPTLTTEGKAVRHSLTELEDQEVVLAPLNEPIFWNISEGEATCTTGVTKTYSSKFASYTITFDPLGHNYTTWTITKNPTETSSGIASRKCSRCGDVDTVILAALTDTTFWEVETVNNPTYDSPGSITYKCEYLRYTVTIDKLVRSFSPWYAEGKVSSNKEITLYRDSLVDDYQETMVVKVDDNFSFDIYDPSNTGGDIDYTCALYELKSTGERRFVYDPNTNTYASNIAGINSATCYLYFTPKVSGYISFDVFVESEGPSFDSFFTNLVSRDQLPTYAYKGSAKASYNVHVVADKYVYMSYSKDSGIGYGLDGVIISNFSFTPDGGGSDVEVKVVSYNTNGGNEIEPTVINLNGRIKLLPEPTKNRGTFEGWYYDNETFNDKVSIGDQITDNVMIYAKWNDAIDLEIKNYNINKDFTFGVTLGTKFNIPVPSGKGTGMSFVGFFKDKDFNEPWDENTVLIDNVTIYAKWVEAANYVGSFSGVEVYGLDNVSYSMQSLTIDEDGNIECSSDLKAKIISYEDGVIYYAPKNYPDRVCVMLFDNEFIVVCGYGNSAYSVNDSNFSDSYVFHTSNCIRKTSDVSVASFPGEEGGYSIRVYSFNDASGNNVTYFVKNGKIYKNVSITDVYGNIVPVNKASTADNVIISSSDGTVLLKMGYNGKKMVELDQYFGIYTGSSDTDILYLDGLGTAHYSNVYGSYNLLENSENILELYMGTIDTGIAYKTTTTYTGGDIEDYWGGDYDEEYGYEGEVITTVNTPFVGENGNWWIEKVDTGICNPSATPYVGKNGNWMIPGRTGFYALVKLSGNSFEIERPTVHIEFVTPDYCENVKGIDTGIKYPCDLPTLSAEGYIFNGWFFDQEFKNKVSKNHIFNEDTTLYAKFSTPVKVTFVYNDFVTDNLEVIFSSNDRLTYSNPTRIKYVFAGWYSTEDFQEGTLVERGTILTSDITLYAKWDDAPKYLNTYHSIYVYSSESISGLTRIETSWSAATISFDEYGQGRGDAYPFRGDCLIRILSETDGSIIMTLDGKDYFGYLDLKYGFIIFNYDKMDITGKKLTNKLFYLNPFAEMAGGDVKSSYWGNGNTFTFSYTQRNKTYSAFVNNGVAYFNVSFKNLKSGQAIDAASAYNSNGGVKVIVNDDIYFDFDIVDGNMREYDRLQGTYTNNSHTIVIDGLGNVTVDLVEYEYVKVSNNTIGLNIENSYHEFVLDGQTYSDTIPMITINFDCLGKGSIDSITINKTKVVNLPRPSSDAFVFRGWLVDGTEIVYQDSLTALEDLNLKAIWKEKAVLTIHWNNGFDDEVVEYAKGETILISGKPYTNGKLIEGYYLDSQFTSLLNIKLINNDMEVFVKWVDSVPFAGTYAGVRVYGESKVYSATYVSNLTVNYDGSLTCSSFGDTTYNSSFSGNKITVFNNGDYHFGYFDYEQGVVILGFEEYDNDTFTPDDDFFIYIKDATKVSCSDPKGTTWNNGLTKLVRLIVDDEVVLIYIDRGNIYYDVTYTTDGDYSVDSLSDVASLVIYDSAGNKIN